MGSNPQVSVAVSTISAMSPSLAETLRNCPLQAGLSRIRALDDYVLGNPKAWLGTAYHEVLENLWARHPELSDPELIDYLWRSAIGRIKHRAEQHPLDRRFEAPEHWSGYNLARPFVQIRAEQALLERPRSGVANSAGVNDATSREEKLWAMEGKLTGKPDVAVGDEIRDYKSGRILETSEDGQETVKQIYVNQLLLYGHLVHEKTGRCPSKGKLLPMQGHEVTVDLNPASCAAAATEAVRLLDKYNQHIATVADAADLATPSPTACRWCQYKSVCLAFWQYIQEDWTEELGSAAVCGQLNDRPEMIHNGKAFAISLSVNTGTTSEEEITIAPLDCSVHTQVGNCQVGEEVRVVNLYRRRDGRLSPSTGTVCMRTVDCPSVSLDNNRKY